MYETLEILPADLPKVPSENGPRDPEYQDLLNLGIFPAGRGLYAFVGVFADGRGQYKPGDHVPGRRCGSGYLEQRIKLLPDDVRARFLRARVLRHRDARQSLRHLVNDNDDPERLRAFVPVLRGSAQPVNQAKALAALEAARALAAADPESQTPPAAEELNVAVEDVRDGDVVAEDLLVPARFAGEPEN